MKAGIHLDIPMPSYVGDPCDEPSLSKGIVKLIWERSMAHAHAAHPRLGGVGGLHSPRADLGSAAHTNYLGGPGICWIDYPDYKKKDAQRLRDEARAAGMVPMLEKHRGAIGSITGRVVDFSERHGVSGDREATIIWQEGGVWLRCRPDILDVSSAMMAYDYKTASSADPSSWIRKSMFPGGYDIQAAMMRRGVRHTAGVDVGVVFIVQEIEPPYACVPVGVGEEALENADRKIDHAIAAWRKCLDENKWPGYDEQIHWADPPGYEIRDFELRSFLIDGRDKG